MAGNFVRILKGAEDVVMQFAKVVSGSWKGEKGLQGAYLWRMFFQAVHKGLL